MGSEGTAVWRSTKGNRVHQGSRSRWEFIATELCYRRPLPHGGPSLRFSKEEQWGSPGTGWDVHREGDERAEGQGFWRVRREWTGRKQRC